MCFILIGIIFCRDFFIFVFALTDYVIFSCLGLIFIVSKWICNVLDFNGLYNLSSGLIFFVYIAFSVALDSNVLFVLIFSQICHRLCPRVEPSILRYSSIDL